jgi:hypothetical protein
MKRTITINFKKCLKNSMPDATLNLSFKANFSFHL